VILLTCSYDGREFVRVGYYVNNEYTDETLAENPPSKPVIDKIRRNILAEKPRVTRFAIKWSVIIKPYLLLVGFNTFAGTLKLQHRQNSHLTNRKLTQHLTMKVRTALKRKRKKWRKR
jgi:hypothetical protein